MNRRNFLVAGAAAPFSMTALGKGESNKPIGFDLPKPKDLQELEVVVESVANHFNERFDGRMGPPQAITHKGNRYITFINGHPKMEGAPFILNNDPWEALQSFYWGIESYLSKDRGKKLLWRV